MSKALLFFFIIMFYAILTVFMGFYGSMIIDTEAYYNITVYDTGNKVGLPLIDNVVTGLNGVPSWVNIILFIPLLTLLLYILITSFVPTLDGGS